ncbi:MAG: tRNA lysidine(34) synthetase TilS [Ruminococcus sp.]|nr:tRNA lysidine(34) synthetase TilS [Ruminococcus sp.]
MTIKTTDFLDKVQNTIEKYQMAEKSRRLLIGLSGGADSAALLLCLYRLGYNVTACHINHCLRGEESDRDEEFCRRLCEKLGISLEVRRVDVIGYCQANSLSTEEGARILRYKAFEEFDCDRICTAHNLNDCLETTIFNLARGSGLKGIASIPPVRDNIIRPLIECSRQEIEDFLSEIGQDYVTDSTNLQDEYSRNKIRHNVLPVLADINPSLMKTFGATLDYLREDSNFLEKTADKAFEKVKDEKGYSCDKISNLDYPIRRRVIMHILSEQGITVSSEKIADIEFLAKSDGKINVKENCFAISQGGTLAFAEKKKKSALTQSPVFAVPDCSVDWCGRKISFEIIEIEGRYENVNKKFANSCLDYDKIKGEIVLRQRLSGDKIQLVNRDFKSDVKKLLKQAFDVDTRNGAVILCDDDGIVMLERFGAADRVKIDESTRRAFVFYETND